MEGYRLLSYREDDRPRAGVLIGDRTHPADTLLRKLDIGASSVLSILEHWASAEEALERAATSADPSDGKPLSDVFLLAPVLYPNAIYCAAANYRDHMHAMAVKLNQPDEPDPHELDINPYHFVVPGRLCTAGPNDPIRLPSHGSRIDWEIELAAIIGRPARGVSPNDALNHVAGYAIGNDVSVRDMTYLKIPNVAPQSLFRTDFVGMKGFDGSCTIGPWLTPARYVNDPQQLALRLTLDDEVMQQSTTEQMVFTVAEQIAYLSHRVTLLPGDVVMTGTPAGTGMERDRFLRPGEVVSMTIDGLGKMTQRVVTR